VADSNSLNWGKLFLFGASEHMDFSNSSPNFHHRKPSPEYLRDKAAWREHERQVIADRQRTGVSPVRQGHIPRWFHFRILRAIREGRLPEPPKYDRVSAWAVLEHAARACEDVPSVVPWTDHFGSTTHDGREAFCCEPYLRPQHLTAARRLAYALQLEWAISEVSWHNPRGTSRIIFFKPHEATP
jgi:hypothetical protein